MSIDPDTPAVNRGRLAANARGYRRDEQLERALALRDSDPAKYAELPWGMQSAAECYADFRAHHDRAIAAGAINNQEAP